MTDLAERSTASIVAGYASVLSGDVGRLLVFAVFIPVLVRVVGSAGYGQYALVMATFLVLRKLLNLGLFEAIKTHVARTTGTERRRIVVTSFIIQLTILAVALPLLGVGIAIAQLDATLTASLQLLLIALAGEQLFLFGRGVLHALNSEGVVEWMIPARSVVLAVVGIGLAATGHGVPGVFTGFAVAFVLTGIAASARALVEIDLRPSPPLPTRKIATTLLRFGLPSMTLTLLTAGLYKADIFLVSYFLSDMETGMYRAALQVSEFIWVVAVAMEMVVIQTTSPLWKNDDLTRISELTTEMLKYTIIITIILIVGVFVLGGNFIQLYFGSDYEPSIRALHILLPGVFGFAIARVIWPILQAGGHLRGIVTVTSIATGLNIVLNVLFIPRFGISGAAAATSISYGGMAVVHTLLAYRVGIAPLSGLPVLRIGGAALITGTILLKVTPLLSALISLLIVPPIGLILYMGSLFAAGVTSPAEIHRFLNEFI